MTHLIVISTRPMKFVAAIAVMFAAQSLYAQPDAADAKPAAGAEYVGSDSCVACHSGPSTRYVQDFVTLHEAETFFPPENGDVAEASSSKRLFHRTDKHAEAFMRLMTKRGAKMTDTLGITDTSKYELGSAQHVAALRDTAEARQCLSCHANWRTDVEITPRFYEFVEEGVSCEACHGPASKWEIAHSRIEWRTRPVSERVKQLLAADGGAPPDSKEALGMIDVRNPIQRAKQCYSCHIGSVEQGKVVTHDMYAAGHPILPGIELEMFATEMPAHWRYLREKGEFELKKDFLAANGLTDSNVEKDLPRTKVLLVGALMALRHNTDQLARQAELAKQGNLRRWPDFASYDCQSCHHELTSPSWRQQRGFDGSPPGRVYPSAWPQALVKLGVKQLADDEETFLAMSGDLNGKLKLLRSSFDDRPFGDPDKILPAATEVVALLDQYASELSQRPIDAESAKRAIEFLRNPDEGYVPDFHSARQIAWAIMVMETEQAATYPAAFPAKAERMQLSDAQTETRAQRRARGRADFQVYRKYLAEVREPAERMARERFDTELFPGLRIRLPAGQGEAASIDAELPKLLRAISEFDPEKFRQQLKAPAED
jgi:hypothetical protein